MNSIQTEIIFLNLLRQADESVFSIVGTNPAGDAGSLRARVVTLYAEFTADKSAFVANPTKIGFLAMLLKEYASFRLSPIDTLGTPEILSPVVRWTEIEETPSTFPPSAHAHVKADISDFTDVGAADWNTLANKPTTFPPAAHTHKGMYALDYYFPGALAAGQTVNNVLPASIRSLPQYRVRFTHATLMAQSPSNNTDIRLDLQYMDSGSWTSIYSNPDDSTLILYPGYYTYGYDATAIPMHAGPYPHYYANDMFRIIVIDAGDGAADVRVILEFEEVM